jgi:hypothetical protein
MYKYMYVYTNIGTNVAALRYMKREIDERKEASMVSYDFSVFDKSGVNAGSNILNIAGMCMFISIYIYLYIYMYINMYCIRINVHEYKQIHTYM